MEKVLHVVYLDGAVITASVIQLQTGHIFDDTDGIFRANPAIPTVALTESGTIPGLYEFRDERTIWADGAYSIIVYEAGTVVAGGGMVIKGDTEVSDVSIPNVTLPTPPAANLQTLYGNVRRLNWDATVGETVKVGPAQDGQEANGVLLSTVKSKTTIDIDGNFVFFVPKATRIRVEVTNHGVHEFTTNSLDSMDIIDYV